MINNLTNNYGCKQMPPEVTKFPYSHFDCLYCIWSCDLLSPFVFRVGYILMRRRPGDCGLRRAAQSTFVYLLCTLDFPAFPSVCGSLAIWVALKTEPKQAIDEILLSSQPFVLGAVTLIHLSFIC